MKKSRKSKSRANVLPGCDHQVKLTPLGRIPPYHSQGAVAGAQLFGRENLPGPYHERMSTDGLAGQTVHSIDLPIHLSIRLFVDVQQAQRPELAIAFAVAEAGAPAEPAGAKKRAKRAGKARSLGGGGQGPKRAPEKRSIPICAACGKPVKSWRVQVNDDVYHRKCKPGASRPSSSKPKSGRPAKTRGRPRTNEPKAERPKCAYCQTTIHSREKKVPEGFAHTSCARERKEETRAAPKERAASEPEEEPENPAPESHDEYREGVFERAKAMQENRRGRPQPALQGDR